MGTVIDIGEGAPKPKGASADADDIWARKRAVELVSQLPDIEADALKVLRECGALLNFVFHSTG